MRDNDKGQYGIIDTCRWSLDRQSARKVCRYNWMVKRCRAIRYLVDMRTVPSFKNGKMAERTGLEPATPGVTGRYSNQLNYRSSR